MSKLAAGLIALSLVFLALPAGAQISESPIGGAAAPPGVETTPPAPPSVETPPPPAPAPKRVRKAPTSVSVEVEPTHARLKLKEDSPVYSKPSKSSKKVAQVHAGKFVEVTGSTKSYLRVQLKTGTTGYIPLGVAELVKPTDKVFLLNADSPVYSQPNRWGKVLAQVHKGHSVRVVGVSLDYMKIKMKDGTQGFIPITALQ